MDVPHQFGLDSLMIEDQGFVTPNTSNNLLRRQDKTNFVARNGPAIVITKPETIKNFDNLYGDMILSYKMPMTRSADIDSIDDLDYVSWLLDQKKAETI